MNRLVLQNLIEAPACNCMGQTQESRFIGWKFDSFLKANARGNLHTRNQFVGSG
jgi:hypothetical protein